MWLERLGGQWRPLHNAGYSLESSGQHSGHFISDYVYLKTSIDSEVGIFL